MEAPGFVNLERKLKEQTRGEQRTALLETLPTSTQEFLQRFISTKEIKNPNAPVFLKNLETLTVLLGKDTHTVLFGLAATAGSRTELINTFFVLDKLGDVEWILTESIKNFVDNLSTPRSLPMDLQAKEIGEKVSRPGEGYSAVAELIMNHSYQRWEGKGNRPFCLEALFNILSSPEVKKPRKEIVVRRLTGIGLDCQLLKGLPFTLEKTILNNPTADLNGPLLSCETVFDNDASFWDNVDASWLQSKRQKKHAQRGDKSAEEAPYLDLAKRTQGLEDLAKSLVKKNQTLEIKDATQKDMIGKLQEDLQTAEEAIRRLQNGIRKQGPPEEDPFKTLGLDDLGRKPTDGEIQDAFRKCSLAHPDRVRGLFEQLVQEDRVAEEVKEAILSVLDRRQAKVNGAHDKILPRQGPK